MSPLRSADRRFAALLDGPATVADPSLASLVSLANALRTAGAGAAPAGPDPAFRAALRQRLVAVATVTAIEPAVATPRSLISPLEAMRARTRRRLAALAGAVAISTSMAGVGFAASMSIPGDPFYNVKRATESVQLWTAHGNLAKGHRNLEFARTRLAEAQQLSPTSSHLAPTLQAMNDETTTATSELLAAYQTSQSPAPLDDLSTFAHQQYAGLVALTATVPPAARAPEQAAAAVLGTVLRQVKDASGSCSQCAPIHPLPKALSGVGGAVGGRSSSAHHQGGAGGRAPGAGASPSASDNPLGGPSPAVSPSTGPTPSPTATPTPTSILPLPSLSPLPTLPPLPPPTIPPLKHHHHKHPLPTLSPLPIVTSILGGLGL